MRQESARQESAPPNGAWSQRLPLPTADGRPAADRRPALGVAALLALTAACSVTPENYASDESAGSTHAVVTIARQERLDGTSRADALVGFLRLPAAVDRGAALELAGLGVQLPEAGHCWQGEPERSSPQLDELSGIEFVDAGRVRLLADGGTPHDLAPHAFPSIGDLISGMLYASRERSGQGLPTGTIYRLQADGGTLGAFEHEQQAPEGLTEVTLNGAPLEMVDRLQSQRPLDIIWSTSSGSADRVYVQLTSSDTSSTTVCAFEDAAGAGTLSIANQSAGDVARLSLHRLRIVHATPSQLDVSVDQVELRFDFSVARTIEFE